MALTCAEFYSHVFTFLETKPEPGEDGATSLRCSGHFLPTNHKAGGQEATNSWHCTGIFIVYNHVYSMFSSTYVLFDLLPKPLYHTCFRSSSVYVVHIVHILISIWMLCVLWSAFIDRYDLLNFKTSVFLTVILPTHYSAHYLMKLFFISGFGL